jgi:hypothetical protein
MNQGDRFREQLIEAMLNDRVGLTAANFHDRMGARHRCGNRVGHLTAAISVAIFLNVFHR